MQLEGPFLLYGAGREGKSSLQFLRGKMPDATFYVTVDKGEAELEGAEFISIEDATRRVQNGEIKTLVRSPGVSIYLPLIKLAKERGLTVTTNINLWNAFRRQDAKIIAVTGTKGKSTTTKLTHAMLKEAGFDAGLAGNIGVALLDSPWHPWMVFEFSSFQCSDLEIQPDFVGLTSLFPEHLDWHEGEVNYFNDKLNLIRRNVPYKLAFTEQVANHQAFAKNAASPQDILPPLEAAFENDFKTAIAQSALQGEHNLHNAKIAARIALAVGADEKSVLSAARNFEPLPHRLQPLHLSGKTFINDSIATNPEATKAALNAYGGAKAHLIIGGYDRDQNYDDLVTFLHDAELATLWCLPDTGWRIAKSMEKLDLNFALKNAESLDDIFAQLTDQSDDFATLILSPGAPSYNQFDNFEQRGERFLELAKIHFG